MRRNFIGGKGTSDYLEREAKYALNFMPHKHMKQQSSLPSTCYVMKKFAFVMELTFILDKILQDGTLRTFLIE